MSAVVAEPVAAGPGDPAPRDDIAIVYGWVSGLTQRADEAEELVVDVFRRSRGTAPACLRGASDVTRLQFLTIQSVLRLRGVI